MLLKHEVEFLIVGGYAVAFHGYDRTTGDMDFWVRPTNENKNKLLDALAAYGFQSEDLSKLSRQNFEERLVFSFGTEPEKVDFLTRVNLVKFDEAHDNKIIVNIEGMPIPIINVEELVLTKINTGRVRDQADLDELQKIQSFRKGKR